MPAPVLVETPSTSPRATSTTFADNLRLPVHRWFRFSAGFSAAWATDLIRRHAARGPTRVLDPFAGGGTTLLAAQEAGAEAIGTEAHAFLHRVARAKLLGSRLDPGAYLRLASRVRVRAVRSRLRGAVPPPLLRACYAPGALRTLHRLRAAVRDAEDGSAAWQLVWLTLVGILRATARVGTAPWQYVLPRKARARPSEPLAAFDEAVRRVAADLEAAPAREDAPAPTLLHADARTCAGVPDGFATLVVTSPPYPNNYDYADATRLEQTFLGEVLSWGDLHEAVRKDLVCSCTQHVQSGGPTLADLLARPEVAPIRGGLGAVCDALERARRTRGGRKAYHLMVASYFGDLARVWSALRRACAPGADVCFVVGDSAPYGVHVPVYDWLTALAASVGFTRPRFEKTRDRNVKWHNRKHRVPLSEGRLWLRG